MGGTDPWDGGDADPICSPPHAVALQEEEKSRISSKLLLHLMVCEQGRVLPGLCLPGTAQRVSKVTPWDNPTNVTGETFPQRKMNIQVCMWLVVQRRQGWRS